MGRRNNYKYQQYQGVLFDEMSEGAEASAGLSGGADFRPAESVSELETPIIDLNRRQGFVFMSFGSGSSGNCSYLGTERGGILIDAGVDIKTVEAEMARNGIRPEKIGGICLTHDHSDHIRYAYSFLRKYRSIRLYCTNRVLNGILRRHNISRRIKDYHQPIFKEIPFKLHDFEITAFEVPHDGSCNSGFSVSYEGERFVLATDLGSITDRARYYMSQANYLVIESNYDAHMLDTGPYPEYLKSRIRAVNGHLDNADAAAFLKECYSSALKYVFLCHLSSDNNTPEIALRTTRTALEERGVTVGEATGSLEDKAKDLQLMVLPRFDATRCFKFRLNV